MESANTKVKTGNVIVNIIREYYKDIIAWIVCTCIILFIPYFFILKGGDEVWRVYFYKIIRIIVNLISIVYITRRKIKKYYDLNKNMHSYLNIIFLFILIIFLCNFATSNVMNNTWEISILLILILELFYFIKLSLKARLDKDKNIDCIIYLVLCIAMIILLYAAIYAMVYEIDFPRGYENFKGPNKNEGLLFFDFLYFSVVNFTTLGFGDIRPVSDLTKGLVISETLIYVVFISIIIMNISKKEKKPTDGLSPIEETNKKINLENRLIDEISNVNKLQNELYLLSQKLDHEKEKNIKLNIELNRLKKEKKEIEAENRMIKSSLWYKVFGKK